MKLKPQSLAVKKKVHFACPTVELICFDFEGEEGGGKNE